MKRTATPFLILLLLASASFAVATILQARFVNWSENERHSVLQVLLGDGRKMFANHFFIKADLYFHSGYYPSIFDQGGNRQDTAHMQGREEYQVGNHRDHHDADDDDEPGFLGPPRDFFEKFGRHVLITHHSHLESGNEREILPWLRLSAELDPQRVETYTTAAFWLRSKLGKVNEAEQFLREGLRANPGSHEILFALGQLYNENYRDTARARNVWELALRRWRENDAAKKEPTPYALEQITVHLARLEETDGNLQRSIDYLEQAKKLSPLPGMLQKQIDELKVRLPKSPPSLSSQ